MTMSVCRFCGARIMWASQYDGGRKIPLDMKAEVFTVEADFNKDGTVRVTPLKNTEAMVTHQATCGRQPANMSGGSNAGSSGVPALDA